MDIKEKWREVMKPKSMSKYWGGEKVCTGGKCNGMLRKPARAEYPKLQTPPPFFSLLEDELGIYLD